MGEKVKKQMRAPIETGAPDGFQYMHPTMRKNFGQWKYHEPVSYTHLTLPTNREV